MGLKGQPITVYFCSAPQTDERLRIALNTWEYWQSQNCDLHFLSPEKLCCSLSDFNRYRRQYAEEHAKDHFYILTDDDCIPVGQFYECVKKATITMYQHPEFAILSFWPVEATIQRWTPEEYEPYEDLDVMEHVSVGGLRVMRRHSQFTWPRSETRGYDLAQADYLREMGKRVGYFQHLRMNHLGEGKSDLWVMEESCV